VPACGRARGLWKTRWPRVRNASSPLTAGGPSAWRRCRYSAPVTAGLPALVFRLGTERYAVELKDVAEVLPFTRCTSVPGAPAEFLGVINLRGELRAVLDLGRVLVSAESGNLDSGFVLVLRRPSQGIGLKVDVIDELREIQREELMPAQGGCFKGLVGGTLILLDVEKVLEKALPKEELLTI
jgi:chemotaxis signal transduction protein